MRKILHFIKNSPKHDSMDSIITQVNREDEQLNAFANDKGKDPEKTTQFLITAQIFVLMKK